MSGSDNSCLADWLWLSDSLMMLAADAGGQGSHNERPGWLPSDSSCGRADLCSSCQVMSSCSCGRRGPDDQGVGRVADVITVGLFDRIVAKQGS